MSPTPDMVSAIILEEMTKWVPERQNARNKSQKEMERMCQRQMTELSERLIRYFSIMSVQPTQLDGLPGGVPYGG